MPSVKVGGGSSWRVKQDAGRNGESGKARNVGQLRACGAAMPSTRCRKDVAGEGFGSKLPCSGYHWMVNGLDV